MALFLRYQIEGISGKEMRERDIFEEIIDIGKRRGKLTYDEINDALPSEFFSPDELEDRCFCQIGSGSG